MFEYMQMYMQLVSFDDIKKLPFRLLKTLITISKQKDRSKDCEHFV